MIRVNGVSPHFLNPIEVIQQILFIVNPGIITDAKDCHNKVSTTDIDNFKVCLILLLKN